MTGANSQILTVAQMQAAEQALIDGGSSVDELMQIAGRGAAEWIWRIAAGRSVTVLCGPGNNGGDGYVIAETLRARGLAVDVIAPLAPTTDAAKKARRALRTGVATSGHDVGADILVDCLFGSGLSRPLSPDLLLLLRDLAERHAYRIAVDLPSGISSDEGALLNDRLPRYDLTLALGAWKYAHWLMPSAAYMGQRRLVPIGVADANEAAHLLHKPTLSPPEPDAHKYTRGLCVIVAGEMPGASLLACKAAMHGGAGYVKLHSDKAPAGTPVDLVVDPAGLTDDRLDAVLVGPGLGRSDASRKRMRTAMSCGHSLVLDADALHLLDSALLPNDADIIATPHEGELASLCKTFCVVAQGKVAQARALARASGMVIVAKGPDTHIAAPDGCLVIAPAATSWLSVAGTGDVLAGIAASRLASGQGAFEAACEAVWLHGDAARRCTAPFTASELAGKVAEAYAACL